MDMKLVARLQILYALLLCLCLGGAGCITVYKSKKIHRMLDRNACQTGYALMVLEREYAIRAEVFQALTQEVVAPDSKEHRRLSKPIDKMSRLLEQARKDRERMMEIAARARSLFEGKQKITSREPEGNSLKALQAEYEEIGDRMQEAGSRFADAMVDFDQKAAKIERAAYCRGNL